MKNCWNHLAAILGDGVRSFGALDDEVVRLWRLGALVFQPDLSLDRSLGQPLCGAETDSSLGGLGQPGQLVAGRTSRTQRGCNQWDSVDQRCWISSLATGLVSQAIPGGDCMAPGGAIKVLLAGPPCPWPAALHLDSPALRHDAPLGIAREEVCIGRLTQILMTS